MRITKSKKLISAILSVLMVLSSLMCCASVSGSAYEVGDFVIYTYNVKCEKKTMAFEGNVFYPSEDLAVEDDSYISVYSKSGSPMAHVDPDKDGVINFHASSPYDDMDFTKGGDVVTVMFTVKNPDFNPASIYTKLTAFYDDQAHVAGTNVPYGYKNIINETVISGGKVDLDLGKEEETEFTEPTSTEYVAPTDNITLTVSDTVVPFVNNNDGTYSASYPFNGSVIRCTFNNTTKNVHLSPGSLSNNNLKNSAQGEIQLMEKDSSTYVIFMGSGLNGTINFVYNYDTQKLSYTFVEGQEPTTNPTDPKPTDPTDPKPTNPSEPAEKEYTVVYKYTAHNKEQTLTKTVKTTATDPTEIAEINVPSIKNPYNTYSLGECTIDNNVVTANLDATEKLYTVSVDGEPLEQKFGYKEQATVTLNGEPYTFFVTGDTELMSDTPGTDVELSYDGMTINDENVAIELLASAKSDKFARMGVVFATSQKSETELSAAVLNVTNGTAVHNTIAVHNSAVDSPNVSGMYQFTYAPYLNKSGANKVVYFYCFVVDTEGNVKISDVQEINLTNIYA